MFEKAPEPTKASFSIIHEGCGGTIEFIKIPGAVPDERICQCGYQETYAPDKALIVGKAGVSIAQLKEFCEIIYTKDGKVGRIDITQDVSNPSINAAVISIPGFRAISDPESFLQKKVSQKYFDDTVLSVFRIPIRFKPEKY